MQYTAGTVFCFGCGGRCGQAQAIEMLLRRGATASSHPTQKDQAAQNQARTLLAFLQDAPGISFAV